MKNSLLIFQYEVFRIIHKKITICSFIFILLFVIGLNSLSIVDYSIGDNGAQCTTTGKYNTEQRDWNAFFNGIPIRYVDDNGNIVERQVGPFEYIRLQKQFAKKWSGEKITDKTIKDMQDFLNQYDDLESDRLTSWSYQNYYWVFRTIKTMGFNPYSQGLSEEFIRNGIYEQSIFEFSNQMLTEDEKDYWLLEDYMEFPLVISYNPAYEEFFSLPYYINIGLIFFSLIVLSDIYSFDIRNRTKQVIAATSKGTCKASVIRFLAGETVIIGCSVVLYGLSLLFQFAIFGTDGYDAPIQMIREYSVSRFNITTGNAVLLTCFASIVIVVTVSALVMFVSELSRNSIVAISVPLIIVIGSLFTKIHLSDTDRTINQILTYFPIQRIEKSIIRDERLVNIHGRMFTAIKFEIVVYFSLLLLFFLVTQIHVNMCRKEK